MVERRSRDDRLRSRLRRPDAAAAAVVAAADADAVTVVAAVSLLFRPVPAVLFSPPAAPVLGAPADTGRFPSDAGRTGRGFARSFCTGFLSFSEVVVVVVVLVVVVVDLETSPFFFLSLDEDEDEDFGFVTASLLLPPPDEPFVEVVPLEVVTFVADEESVPVEDERAGPSSDFARSTDISRPCSSVRCRWLMHSVASFADAIVTYP